MNYKGFIATDLDNLQFRSEVPDSVGTWTFKEFKKGEYSTLFNTLSECNSDNLSLLLKSLWDNEKLWFIENLNLMNFGANQVLEAISPYGYDMQRKIGNIYGDIIDHIEVYKQIFYQPVDSKGVPLEEELILECIFEQYFIN